MAIASNDPVYNLDTPARTSTILLGFSGVNGAFT